MGALSNLEPKGVFTYFEEICGIPHGSGHTDQLSDYLVGFADRHGLACQRDTCGNVILRKEASLGYEEQPALILQGHMDMVTVKVPGLAKDMTKEGIEPVVQGDRITGKGTSLGGDNGIALAYGMALLADDSIPHPPLEVIFTVGEEVGMDGARAIDLSELSGRRLLNLDSEEEGVFCVGCAGGARADALVPFAKTDKEGTVIEIILSGLTGGHSGIEIHKHGGNANVLLGRLLQQLVKERGAGICKIRGGLADNAIPREARATVVVPYESLEGLEASLAQVQMKWREELQNTDPDLSLRMHAPNDEEVTIPASCGLEEVTVPASCGTEEEDMSLDCDTESEAKGDKSIGYAEEEDTSIDGASEEDTSLNSDAGAAAKGDKSIGCVDGMEAERMCSYLTALPNGVQAMSKQMKGVVETSLNLGLMKLDACGLHTRFSVRSSLESAKAALLQTITLAASSAGGTVTITGDYPGWAYRSHSPLRDKMTKIYQDMYHSTPLTVAIHAGLECGIFCGKLEGLDCVSIGPNMGSVHTTEEYLEISSVKRVWEFLLRLLAEKE